MHVLPHMFLERLVSWGTRLQALREYSAAEAECFDRCLDRLGGNVAAAPPATALAVMVDGETGTDSDATAGESKDMGVADAAVASAHAKEAPAGPTLPVSLLLLRASAA